MELWILKTNLAETHRRNVTCEFPRMRRPIRNPLLFSQVRAIIGTVVMDTELER